VGAKIPQENEEEGRKEDDDRLAVSQLSPSKSVESHRRSNPSFQNSAPTPGTPLAISPMRPSRKRASAGQESDTEPDGAWPDEWEKSCWITESNREGEVRGGEGKEIQQARRVAGGEKPRALPQASHSKKNGVASSSLTLTGRLKAKAARESPRVRKLRDKLTGRVGAGRGAGGRRSGVDFSGNVGASTATNIAMFEGKGTYRVAGPTMPYSGDNVSLLSWLEHNCWGFEI